MSFDELKLKDNLLRGIYAYGFEKPSYIQKHGIPPFTEGRDTIAQAQSGTGKTGCFMIGILQNIQSCGETTALVMAPTRELATQIHKVAVSLAQHLDVTISLVIGGQFQSDLNADIIIGTPGRIYDLIRRNRINPKTLRMFVLDEADEMLSRGFLEQIKNIFYYLPKNIQVGLFSATMSPEIMEITSNFMRDPVKILVKNEELTLEGIKQYYVVLDRDDHKFDVLADLYQTISITQTIIYCNSKQRVNRLKEDLEKQNFTVNILHGDMTQDERNEVMSQFRSGGVRILITTDILSRGIDIQQVSLVINYDLPYKMETYIHRIGRSGRFGRKGVAINLITQDEVNTFRNLEKYYSTSIDELPMNVSEVLI